MWKKGLAPRPQAWTLGTLAHENIFTLASGGANVANSTIQGIYPLPTNTKISKVAVAYSAVNAVDGTHKFNIVLGTGAYTQGSVAANDNSNISGYATNPAVAGNALFAADIPITNAAANAYSSTTGQGWVTVATGGGYGIFVPTNYDAIYPANVGPLTLRIVTPASTGSITTFVVTVLLEPVPFTPTYVPQTQNPTGPIAPGPSF